MSEISRFVGFCYWNEYSDANFAKQRFVSGFGSDKFCLDIHVSEKTEYEGTLLIEK